jgi:hypothetical protein
MRSMNEFEAEARAVTFRTRSPGRTRNNYQRRSTDTVATPNTLGAIFFPELMLTMSEATAIITVANIATAGTYASSIPDRRRPNSDTGDTVGLPQL